MISPLRPFRHRAGSAVATRRATAVATAAVLVLLFAACGANSSADAVAKAAAASLGAGGAKVAVTETTKATGGATVRIVGGGTSDATRRTARMIIQFQSASTGNQQSAGTIRELFRDSTVYMISPLFRASIPHGKVWVKVDLRKSGHSSGFDVGSFSAATPSQTLELLQHAVGAKKLGSEPIDGVQATHYRARIDAQAGSAAKAGPRVSYRPVDVWIDPDGRIKRVHLVYSAGGSTGDLTATYSHYGTHFAVPLPPRSLVFEAPTSAAGQGTDSAK